MWFSLASAAAGDEIDAGVSREDAAKHLTPHQLAEAQRMARDWKP
jgi:hypothetical protein